MAAKPELRALTGLRFFAALHVVAFHFAGARVDGLPWWLRNVVHCGYVGVSLFFVLSGFILAYNYLSADVARVELRLFWSARFARVYPVYLLGLVIALPLFLWSAHDASGRSTPVVGAAATTLLLLQAWVPPWVGLWNGPSWSLSAEAFFYALFPVLGTRLVARPAPLLISAIGIWFLSWIAPITYMVLEPDGLGYVTSQDHLPWLNALKFNPLARLPEFAIGAIAGKLFLINQQHGRADRPARAITLMGLALCALVTMFSSLIPFPLMHNVALTPGAALLIYGLASSRGAISGILSSRIMELLGQSSYALYILHMPIGQWAQRWGGGWRYTPLVFLITCLLGSIAVLRGIEEPARRLLRQALATSRAAVSSRSSEKSRVRNDS